MIERLPKCPICFSAKIRHVKGSVTVTRRKKRIVVNGISYDRCGHCGEQIIDYDNSCAIDRAVFSARKRSTSL